MSVHLQVLESKVSYNGVYLITLSGRDMQISFKFDSLSPLRTALTHYLDINNPPRTNVLRELSVHASDPEEAAKLKKMGNGMDKEGYNEWVVEYARYRYCEHGQVGQRGATCGSSNECVTDRPTDRQTDGHSQL